MMSVSTFHKASCVAERKRKLRREGVHNVGPCLQEVVACAFKMSWPLPSRNLKVYINCMQKRYRYVSSILYGTVWEVYLKIGTSEKGKSANLAFGSGKQKVSTIRWAADNHRKSGCRFYVSNLKVCFVSKVIMQTMLSSNVEFQGFDYQQTGVYLALTVSK